VSAMQSDLNQLRTAMEMYYQGENRFSYVGAGPDDLGFDEEGGFTDGVVLNIDAATATAWSATATHNSTENWSCSYDSEDGIILCEEDGD